MAHPHIDGAPGLCWQRRRSGLWAAVWIARRDIRKRGFRPSTALLWTGAELTAEHIPYLQSECQRLQDEMLCWSRGGADALPGSYFDGSLHSLIQEYRQDPDSPYNRKLRYRSKLIYDNHLDAIDRTVGARAVAALRGRDFMRWHEQWSAPESAGDDRHVPRAHARITMLRILFGFGIVFEHDQANCARLSAIMSEMEFERGKPRDTELTAQNAIDIRRRAHELGRPSVALAQAIQFELLLRQKDVIGEWLPIDHPGVSAVTSRGRKWLLGMDWREISEDLILIHRLSKSIKGQQAYLDPRAGKTKAFDLKLYPMVMEELHLITQRVKAGPVIVDETSGLPYARDTYRRLWRDIADAAGLPKTVQNRDSRAGGITEGVNATDGDMEANRHAAGHSKLETTLRYSRAGDRQTAKVAVLRATKRNGPTTP